ncbi:MAG: DNA-directed RNA polymerase subunit beta' [Candidatus Gracilibacteria bacterium]|nr:DNA-directed RNA polymerase subunit beta' [Candidatus Gracilibacteria bacterium]MDQ7022126.1 DNA-directed RNA polymerase subunit beta' [Candidatus Gracilibacteria bacterium]
MFEQSKELDNFLNDKITDFSEIGKDIGKADITKGKNLDNLAGISIGVTSPEKIRALSHGKVLISETINYRTQKPERGGLFCEQIFGPRKNYECACGKYKRIRYKGVVCERCGVEVTKASVRRERMAHIDLYAPIAHIWYMKSVPSRIGLLLNLPVKQLEQVVYFASYIITDIYEDKRDEAVKNLEERYKVTKVETQKDIQREVNELKLKREAGELTKKKFEDAEHAVMSRLEDLDQEFDELKKGLTGLNVLEVVGELEYRVLAQKFPHVFEGGTGAEYLKKLLERIDLKEYIIRMQAELKVATQAKSKKLMQKIKLASNLLKSGQKPEWFILTALPIVPPDLRPMIQLDGGRFASSDLNDLYRRVINRNNRLKKLIDLGAPDVILKNEKRMLQESVDMLITGSTRSNRSGFVSANKKELKSLTEVLKGKQGRFRQNLLGKRVDYSARSVIVVGPTLPMDCCGVPKRMAVILFKPFIISKLIEDGYVYNVKHAEKFIEKGTKEVWDALDEVIEGKYVIMNRAPTLHRLSVQAFRPVLIEGKAIQLHPLTCTAFNADFDGDQMAIHLPITPKAQAEARDLMVTSKNLLAPSSGDPIVTPSQDMILGCYYVTAMDEKAKGSGQLFATIIDAGLAYDAGAITMKSAIKVRINGEIVETTYGRLLFNEIVPEELGFVNETIGKGALKRVLSISFDELGAPITAKFVNDIKNFGFESATISGLSISKEDMVMPEGKKELLEVGGEKVKLIQKAQWNGFVTGEEKYNQSIAIWAEVKKTIEKEMKSGFDKRNHVFAYIDSGARGNWGNVTQMCGMKGLVASTSGKTIELPIKSTLKEGFSTLEYFIATHGGRKGKSDTALKTAQSGYLTRRLVDSSQNLIIKQNDCKSVHYKTVKSSDGEGSFSESFEDRIYSHTIATDIKNTKGDILIEAGAVVDKTLLKLIAKENITEVNIRSVLTCESEGGVCQKCYGLDLGLNIPVEIGTPVGVIAAQSIGEPGTQLTMRTFHSGGVAKEGGDMTQGLSRVEELLEARIPKSIAEISDIEGIVEVNNVDKNTIVKVTATELVTDEYYYSDKFEVAVKVGQEVKAKQIIARNKVERQRLTTKFAGRVTKVENGVIEISDIEYRVYEYSFDIGTTILVKDGDSIIKGQKLTLGNLSLQKLMDVSGVVAAEQYIVDDIKAIYASQGQTVNSKHIEIIIRQMFSRVRVLDKGDSEFFPGDIVDIIKFKNKNDELMRNGKKAGIAERLLLGITKISLFTESWLSAASFQETVRVLVESSVSGKIDKLEQLKENVIIGRLIPAGKEYRRKYGFEEEKVEVKKEEEEYFDSKAEEVDVSEAHMEEILKEMETESNF